MKFPAALILTALLTASSYGGPAEKPNIILIISDDQSFTGYGFMGHKIVKTPQTSLKNTAARARPPRPRSSTP